MRMNKTNGLKKKVLLNKSEEGLFLYISLILIQKFQF